MGKENKRPWDFNAYIYSLSDESRLAILDNLKKHGDPNEVMSLLLNTPACCQTKKVEIRINDRFLLWHRKETMFSHRYLFLHPLDRFVHCYFVRCVSGGDDIVGLTNLQDSPTEYKCPFGSDSRGIYALLRHRVQGIENITGQVPAEADILEFAPFAENVRYLIRGNTVLVRREGRKVSENVLIENIQDIAWCEQVYGDGGEDTSYDVRLYLRNQKRPVELTGASAYQTYEMAAALKKRIPHMLYGPSAEYEKLFKEDPQKLMALAKGTVCAMKRCAIPPGEESESTGESIFPGVIDFSGKLC